MSSLLDYLNGNSDYQMAVVTAAPVKQIVHSKENGIDFFLTPSGKNNNKRNMIKALNTCASIISNWNPDLIHIHGTERFYGLLSARNIVDIPTVISVQGLLGPYSEWYHFFGNKPLIEIVRMHRIIEPLVLRGPLWNYWNYIKAARLEKEIIRGNTYFLGRTSWDKSHVLGMNPEARYYHVGETLRSPFWNNRWRIDKCKKFRIIFTNAGHPRKGADILFEAALYLRKDFPDIEVCIAGPISKKNGYGRYLRKKMACLGSIVKELGMLTAEEMTSELMQSHVFVSPSFIDNSPNAVCEAQLMGMPVVSSYTGGVPSLIDEGNTGLFFPTGDPEVLSSRIRDIFLDDQLAQSLGKRANAVARKRHANEIVFDQLKNAYTDIINKG